MTFRQWAIEFLTQHGLWPQEAEAVLAAAIAHPANEAMATRWDDDMEGYPPAIANVLRMSLSYSAVEWIDANKPQHFARMMFVAPASTDTPQ